MGVNMPGTAVADLEIHTATMDLIAATHGRGIYKLNLKPLQEIARKKSSTTDIHFFTTEQAKRPWFNSSGGEPDYRTIEKTSFTFWLSRANKVRLQVLDSVNKEIWSTELNATVGLNEFRWDLIVSQQQIDLPYFIHYDKFIEAGVYTVSLSFGDTSLEQRLVVVRRESPYKK